MAKDKSTKKASVVDDDFAKPSDAPAGGEGWQLAHDDNLGKLFLITPLRIDHVKDTFSKSPARRKRSSSPTSSRSTRRSPSVAKSTPTSGSFRVGSRARFADTSANAACSGGS